MRPVDPGRWPLTLAGELAVYDEYGYAKPNLTARLGHCCSFCGMKVASGLAIEHVVAKKDAPELERDWANFLLACHSCNSTKARKVKSLADMDTYLWPHRDRTFDAFDYRGGRAQVARDLDAELARKAEATDRLVGLSLPPTREKLLKGSDNRWRHRLTAHRVAMDARQKLEKIADPQARAEMIETIKGSAEGHGFWSIWMTVFARDIEVQDALRTVFPGTAPDDRVYPLPRHLGSEATRIHERRDGGSRE